MTTPKKGKIIQCYFQNQSPRLRDSQKNYKTIKPNLLSLDIKINFQTLQVWERSK